MARTVTRSSRRSSEDEEQPTRGRRRDHDEEPKSRRRTPSSSRDEDEPDFDDDDEEQDEKPRRRATKVKEKPSGKGRSGRAGWGGVKEAKESLGDYAKDLKLEQNEEILIHFGDPEPFDVYAQHWIERSGKRSFTCGEEAHDECPLCEIGDKPNPQVAFNVISLADPDEPALYRWVVGVKLANLIQEFAEDSKTSPINGINQYFAVKRTKKNNSWNTSLIPVKARDLEEDYDVTPLTQDEIDDLMKDAYDYTSTEDTPLKVLEDIADELA